jgi:hypothetical protein
MIMSVKTFDSALDFVPASDRKPAQRGVLAALVEAFKAVREGIDAAGEYNELTSRGVASDVAARRVFDKIGNR